jgi:hypothetical protein
MRVKGRAIGFTFVGLLAGLAPAAAQGGVQGCWVGNMGSGAQTVRVILQLQKAGTPSSLHFMNRALTSDTLQNLVVRGDSVRFDYGTGDRQIAVAAARGSGGALLGRVTRGDSTHPMRLERAGAKPDPATALMGYWGGALSSGGTKVLSSGLRFAPAPCGQVYVTLDSPDQGANNLPITAISLVGDSLHFEMSYLGGAFHGTVSADREHISGTWTQSGNVLDLALTKEAKQ